MVVFNQLKKFFTGVFAAIMVFFLSIPYGSAPSNVEIRSTTFDNGPVVCTWTEEGAEANIQINCHNKGTPFTTDLQGILLVRVYKMLDDGDTRVPSQDVPVCWEYDYAGSPLYIKNGQDYTLNVCVTFGDYSKPGTYCIEITMHSTSKVLYEDALIISPAA